VNKDSQYTLKMQSKQYGYRNSGITLCADNPMAFVTLYGCRCCWQERRHAGVWDIDTKVNHSALRLSTRGASTNHTVWSKRNRKDFPRTSTGRIPRVTVRCFTGNAANAQYECSLPVSAKWPTNL